MLEGYQYVLEISAGTEYVVFLEWMDTKLIARLSVDNNIFFLPVSSSKEYGTFFTDKNSLTTVILKFLFF